MASSATSLTTACLLPMQAGRARSHGGSVKAARPPRPPPKPRELKLASRARGNSDSSDDEEPPSEVPTFLNYPFDSSRDP